MFPLRRWVTWMWSSRLPCPEGGLILPLSFPQALSTEFRVHWRGGRTRPARTGLRWSPGPMNSFFSISERCSRSLELGSTTYLCPDVSPLLSFLTTSLAQSSAKKQNIILNDSEVSSYMSLKHRHLFDPNSEPISLCADLSGPWSWYEYYFLIISIIRNNEYYFS